MINFCGSLIKGSVELNEKIPVTYYREDVKE